ncbi:MAG: protein-glutamate O-methyltransferase CheR [Cellvibrionaceae bacterium]|nr:protein-glutamate O-methyltransferase CheR [Cellvibrionaceae bacterium]
MAAEAQLDNKDFSFIQTLIYDETGIVIGDHKRDMICRRLNRRVRDLHVVDLSEYCQMLRHNAGNEMHHFINAVTTNLTSFFRENHHFDYLRDDFLPKFIASGSRRLRLWSSACSTGEEPYSIAMTLLEFLGHQYPHLDAKILATDLDTNVIKTAKKGVYQGKAFNDLPKALLQKWFHHNKEGNCIEVSAKLRDAIRFNQLNLLGSWPMKGPFDVIFCRNVFIYFDKQTQQKLIDRFCDLLSKDGILFLGHSESILKGNERFESLGRTIYRKT